MQKYDKESHNKIMEQIPKAVAFCRGVAFTIIVIFKSYYTQYPALLIIGV
jgi:hypothetical protein